MLGEAHSCDFSPPHRELGVWDEMVKLVDNSMDGKKACGTLLNKGIGFLGSLHTWPSLASGIRMSISLCPTPQHLGQGGTETAFSNSTGAVGTLLEEADGGWGAHDCPGPRQGL